jgi:hypothetical protein
LVDYLRVASYDKLDWHYDSAIEAGQPPEHAFVHIGFYLVWLIRHDLHNPKAFPPAHIEAVRRGEMSGTDLADDVDTKLVSMVMNEEGRAFSDARYPTYLEAYSAAFSAQPEYTVVDDPANFARIEPVIDELYAAWLAEGRPKQATNATTTDFATSSMGSDTSPELSREHVEVGKRKTARPEEAGPGRPGPDAPEDFEFEMVDVRDLPRPHEAPDLERIVVERLGIAANDVSSVSASHWGSSLLNRSLKRLAVRPRDAVVVTALAGSGDGSVMVIVYSVPGVSRSLLETEFASAIHQPSSRDWRPSEVNGQHVLVSKDRDFIVIYWAADGLVFHLGASANVDLSELVGRLANEAS